MTIAGSILEWYYPDGIHIGENVRGTSEGTRRKILAAADELFYGEGIRAASVDAIAERAGLTKRTLYYHFESKDELIGAYLEARDIPTLEKLREAAAGNDLKTAIYALFKLLARSGASPRWKGCAFIRAVHELAGLPGHPAFRFARQHKKALEAWFAQRIKGAGIPAAETRARQLMVILDGAITQMLIHREPIYAETSAEAAVAILGLNGSRRRRPGNGKRQKKR